MTRPRPARSWVAKAVATLDAEAASCADTPLRELRVAGFPDIRFLLKDESTHPSGSLKHRLARSLFLYALCSGRLGEGQTVVDASSGSTAISEAYFARLLGLPFVAVMPESTASAKQREITAYGGICELVQDPVNCAVDAASYARDNGACYLDQFGLASSATDWRGNNNIAESILSQVSAAGHGDPDWIVCGAGTGGTSATIGRYLRYTGSHARLCVAEPAGAAFARGWQTGDRSVQAGAPSLIEGIGRPCVEPCFTFELVDEVIEVPDVASIAAAWLLHDLAGECFGGSSGTNFVAALQLAAVMRAQGESGSIVILLGDRGERYADTLFDPLWLHANGLDLTPWSDALRHCSASGEWRAPYPV